MFSSNLFLPGLWGRLLYHATRILNLSCHNSDPTAESEFTEQIVSNVTEIVPGHQCYKIASIPSTVTAGSNATIQLEYWAHYEEENSGNNETFYACADIVRRPHAFFLLALRK